MLDALRSPDRILAWQDRRYQFAYQVGQPLIGAVRTNDAPVTGDVVYGVYVEGGGLLYVGQTSDAKRRLRDLPVGENHHFAMTVPPERWEHVLIVEWPGLLAHAPDAEAKAAERLGLATCGTDPAVALRVAPRIPERPVRIAAR